MRGRSIAWMFAALNTVEPPIVELEAATLMENDQLAVFTAASNA